MTNDMNSFLSLDRDIDSNNEPDEQSLSASQFIKDSLLPNIRYVF